MRLAYYVVYQRIAGKVVSTKFTKRRSAEDFADAVSGTVKMFVVRDYLNKEGRN